MTPRPEECQEKARLLAELKLAMATVIGLNNRQIELARAGQSEAVEFLKAKLHTERIRRSNLVSAYRSHVHRHGC